MWVVVVVVVVLLLLLLLQIVMQLIVMLLLLLLLLLVMLLLLLLPSKIHPSGPMHANDSPMRAQSDALALVHVHLSIGSLAKEVDGCHGDGAIDVSVLH